MGPFPLSLVRAFEEARQYETSHDATGEGRGRLLAREALQPTHQIANAAGTQSH